ncbi:unnamed protein product [Psylliodes chrysocephalus]|uniref:Uncharacterized protein n=1 Tax=Psylliodes chrysocephalus TaxID=3402493 RepID=A0A9P0GD43_9CUCU|nr:unnamed protein product [Psylliodes chrysocephala]
MQYKSIFLVLTLFVVVENCLAILPLFIELGIKVAMDIIKNKFNVKKDLLPLKIPDAFTEYAIGNLDLRNFSTYGFNTLTYTDKVISLPKEGRISKENITINLNLAQIGLKTDYDIDIGVLDLLPVFGKGGFQIGIADINLYMNLVLNDIGSRNLSIADLNVQLSIRHSKENYITGFWHNDAVSRFLTEAINVIEPVVCALYDYNYICIDCIISQVLEFLINLLVLKAHPQPHITCTCLDGSEFNIKENLNNFLYSTTTGNFEQWTKQNRNNPDLIKLLQKVYNSILLILEEENIKLNVYFLFYLVFKIPF